jgi:DNA-binding response OmpR family regulator
VHDVSVAEQSTATVVVVDDEEDLADLYATWLSTDHDVRTTYSGEQALSAVDESVDVVLLDRQMPGTTGDQVLEQIAERGIDCRVLMVTAVDPDFDIVEMPFDDYLTKPVTRDDLVAAVEEMLRRERYDEQLQEYFAAASKKATLESRKDHAELEHSEDYAEITRRVEELAAEAEQTATTVEDPESLFQDFPTG